MFDCVFGPSYALVKDAAKHAAITLHPGALQQCVVDFDDLEVLFGGILNHMRRFQMHFWLRVWPF